MSLERTISGLIAVADPIREESQSILKKLKEIGIRHTVMLTGDHEQTAEAIANNLGMTDVRAGLMPEDKLTAIKQLEKEYGRVAMVGDGINDAPALAASSVGIAMGGAGTDAALETADIALMADDLEKLPYTIKLSRKTLRIIKENIMFALGLKIVALLLIIPGWLTLWIAIFADMGATMLVVLNSLRLIRFISRVVLKRGRDLNAFTRMDDGRTRTTHPLYDDKYMALSWTFSSGSRYY